MDTKCQNLYFISCFSSFILYWVSCVVCGWFYFLSLFHFPVTILALICFACILFPAIFKPCLSPLRVFVALVYKLSHIPCLIPFCISKVCIFFPVPCLICLPPVCLTASQIKELIDFVLTPRFFLLHF